MKTNSIFFALAIVAASICSCKKIDVVPEHPGIPVAVAAPDQINPGKFITDGIWKISEFKRNGQDLAVNYIRWHFRFSDAGVITASTFREIQRGKWTNKYAFKSVLVIDFNELNGFPMLTDLSNDWIVVTASENEVRLKDLADGGGAQTLVFKKAIPTH